jgi:hypothetical protein
MARRFGPRRPVAALLAAALVAIAGCGGDGVKVVPAEGVVKIDGRPAANVLVQFMPDSRTGGKGQTSSALTDENGKFRLKTQDGRDGAAVGTHMVALIDSEEDRPAQGKAAKKGRLDGKYATPVVSGLTANVSEGGGPVTLEATAPR